MRISRRLCLKSTKICSKVMPFATEHQRCPTPKYGRRSRSTKTNPYPGISSDWRECGNKILRMQTEEFDWCPAWDRLRVKMEWSQDKSEHLEWCSSGKVRGLSRYRPRLRSGGTLAKNGSTKSSTVKRWMWAPNHEFYFGKFLSGRHEECSSVSPSKVKLLAERIDLYCPLKYFRINFPPDSTFFL